MLAYYVGGLVLDVPAKSIPALVEWTLKEAQLRQTKLSGPGKDADPLLVLTEAALERYGLLTSRARKKVQAAQQPASAGADHQAPHGRLIDMGNHITQRQTGRTSMSRSDSAWA